ncbi:MAG TPA: adenylate/guanylate cyclase domain-containing protein [Candidatus Dormibacteraeota bacterium]|nr:adenylate/guanylate cyclase domain-containing protein [Candidatus Dormibacteraeota bacterium]
MPSTPDPGLPSGTVTFLFTDIEGSTRLLSDLGDRYVELISMHGELIRGAVAAHAGTEVSTEGDSFFAVFPSAVTAVRAAADAQRALASQVWPADATVLVRMGLHTGEGRLGADNYVGLDVHRASRIAAAGHGGQVLLSEGTRALVAQQLPDGVAISDLGEHRLKDLPTPERIWQLEIDGLPREFPALRSLDARPNNLPLSPTPLIGRVGQLAQATDLLLERRLLTLTGPGGAGKTRIALAVAERLLPKYADGAFFVGLEDAHDRTDVASRVAAAVGVRERPDRDLEQGVKDHLRERELLLVLDNFEQVVSAAPLVAELIAGAPRLRIIVTSRAVLHLAGEQDLEVPPLSLPDPQHLPALAALSQYEAVALFIERAGAVKPDFAVTNENAPAVAQICSRLDGLPLAIELAAARVRLLTPEAILDRLERSLPVLASGSQDLPTRQRTLRGAIDWSHQLLGETERILFRRLAAFAGGWTLDAAEEVCNPNRELGIETIDGIASLVDESLIHPADGDATESRFAMLQVIREFATEKLDESPDGEDVRRRHAGQVLELAEEAEPQLVRVNVRSWQHRLRREEENLRTALRWAVERSDAETGSRTAGSLWRFWHYWGQLREGIRWLESMLELAAGAQPSAARAKALSGLAGLVYWLGDAERADTLYQEALSIHRQLGDGHLIAETLFAGAYTAVGRNDFAAAIGRAQAAHDEYERIGDRAGELLTTAWLRTGPYLMGVGGSFDDALAATLESVEASRQLGRALDEADGLGTLATIYQKAGDFPRALELFKETTRAWWKMGNVGMLIWAKMGANLELALGRPERAARLAAIAAQSVQELGGELPEALIGPGDPLEETRQLLPEDEYARAVSEGRAMGLDEAAAYILEEDPVRPRSSA